ncbi:MAG: hypothetical protein ACR2F8_02925 [Caulobacteraceae bacterium]
MARPSATLTDAFDRFWAAYPPRPDNPKAAAREVFLRRVREGADPEAIVRAAGRYSALVGRLRTDSAFVAHARTWLSQRRYEDFPEPPAPAPAPATEAHPLAWLAAEIGEAAWKSWIGPLRVDGATVTAPTRLALETAAGRWGRAIEARMGEVAWKVRTRESGDVR